MIHEIATHSRPVEKLDDGSIVYVCNAEGTRRHRFVAPKLPPLEFFREPQAMQQFHDKTLMTSAVIRSNKNPGRGGGVWA